jgi:hypothetical protein
MHPDPQVVLWPDYQEFYGWLCQEVDGLTDAELDFDSHDPAHEWMWWSIRRQVSHMAWDLLIVMYRRCHTFLWPDGNIPAPIRWEDHRLGSMQYDRATTSRHRGTPFWRYVIQVLPRGAWVDAHDPQFMHYTLEASLWMLYYEVFTHLYTIQRLKRAQGLSTRVVLPRVGYLTLPEYTGEAASPGPSFVPLR